MTNGNKISTKHFRRMVLLSAFLFVGTLSLNAGPVQGATCTSVAGQSCVAAGTTCASAGLVNGTGTCSSGVCCNPAVASTTTNGKVDFQNPLGFSTVQGMTGAILNSLKNIIVALALVFLVIGAVLYVISGGDDGKIKTAKGTITAALIGLAIALAAPAFLKQIYDILGGTPTTSCAGLSGTDLANCNAVNTAISQGPTLSTILQHVLTFLLATIGIVAIIMLIIGGFMFIFSAGDTTRADSAKKIVVSSLIGIAVAAGALILVTQVAAFFTR